ncbi:MAG: hypothetical protein CL608_30275 [Anaerolineaceae bacterium]|nr:hypothetical protein [Anaerolineaceae bacterium]
MLSNLSRYWWLLALRGVAAVIFGILAFVWPQLTLGVLVILFGAYVFVDGVANLITGISDRNVNERWGLMLLEGIVGITAGVLTFVYPGITAVALLYIIAFWAVLTGVLEVAAAVRLREEIEGEWALGLSGIVSVLLGLALIIFPGAGALAVIWMIGAYAILFGALMIYLGFKLRGSDTPELKHA